MRVGSVILAEIKNPNSAEREDLSLSDWNKLLVVSLMVVLANTLDLLSTYIVSPNLANEWNVLERVFGLGWAGLIFAKIIGGAIAVAGYYFYLSYRKSCYPAAGADFDSFCRTIAYGQGSRSKQDNIIRYLFVNLGYFWAGMQLLIFWVALDNILLKFGIVFPLRQYSEIGYHLFQSMIVASIVLYRFYHGNYSRYLKLQPALIDRANTKPV